MARFFALLLALVASASAFTPLARPMSRSIKAPLMAMPQGESSTRGEFLKKAAVAAAAVVAAAPAANAGGNPAAFVGKGPNAGKGKKGQIKTGNAGSILKR
eukprot:CAMPEP_0172590496 /NCGR_PEP_ID=MMETSP1068-20121228/9020_1 /TAXON_ID=35684 /ORGANISM="Pseudopedinella elastica, Strain CCMP716" /LENGTH=100 /DNA_ID=CAMNT_0013386401 /DNA_START=46 /DNA_END=348 /DNA_ORIENTATION=-